MPASANSESKFASLEVTCICGNTDLTSRKTLHRPAGSAAMGKVLDSNLRVFRVQSLRVVDASVFPVPISGHDQACGDALVEQGRGYHPPSELDGMKDSWR